jgi:hypothetical protein
MDPEDVLRDEYGFVLRIDEMTVSELRSAQETHERQRKVWSSLLQGRARLDVLNPEVREIARKVPVLWLVSICWLGA